MGDYTDIYLFMLQCLHKGSSMPSTASSDRYHLNYRIFIMEPKPSWETYLQFSVQKSCPEFLGFKIIFCILKDSKLRGRLAETQGRSSFEPLVALGIFVGA